MEPHRFFPLLPVHLSNNCISAFFFFVFLLLAVPSSHGQEDDYENCQRTFTCGYLDNLSYPFWGGKRPVNCGRQGFQLECKEGRYPLLMGTQPFRVLNVNPSLATMTIARDDYYYYGVCQENPSTTTLDNTLVSNPGNDSQYISIFYNCTKYMIGRVSVPHRFTCPISGEDGFYAYEWMLRSEYSPLEPEVMQNCKMRVEIPVQTEEVQRLEIGQDFSVDAMLQVIRQGFTVSYSFDCLACIHSGGTCTFDGRGYYASCFKGRRRHRAKKLIIGLIFGVFTTSIILGITFGLYKLSRKGKENNVDIRTFISNRGALAIKRYRFKEIKKMTDSFKDKLGEGGFGSVYKGKLFDGQLIAVKVLKASKGNGIEFFNEVASISRTSHVNVVTLLGYCFTYNKRILIYEFMANGSLDKFIHDSNPGMHLQWQKRLEIANGVARGLEYLHRGCNARIIHFDIKPHNVLLDDDFHPKISDFGLAKLSNARESIMSMLEVRGTVGYIAPEVFNRNFGGVSSKSDVYSFGMLLLEIVGVRQREHVQVDGTSGSSNYYFPNWIYKQIELEKYDFSSSLTMEEVEVVKRMTIVGLCCIQTIPSSRPTMSQVIEMLEGSMTALKIPPKPFLFSPPRLLESSYTTSTLENAEIARLT